MTTRQTRKLRPKRPDRTIDLLKGNPKGKRGLFTRIAFGRPSVAARRREHQKAASAGYFTPEEEFVGRGGASTIRIEKLGDQPTINRGGPARRKVKE